MRKLEINASLLLASPSSAKPTLSHLLPLLNKRGKKVILPTNTSASPFLLLLPILIFPPTPTFLLPPTQLPLTPPILPSPLILILPFLAIVTVPLPHTLLPLPTAITLHLLSPVLLTISQILLSTRLRSIIHHSLVHPLI